MSKNDVINTFLTDSRLLAVSILNERPNPLDVFVLSMLLSNTATLSLPLKKIYLSNFFWIISLVYFGSCITTSKSIKPFKS